MRVSLIFKIYTDTTPLDVAGLEVMLLTGLGKIASALFSKADYGMLQYNKALQGCKNACYGMAPHKSIISKFSFDDDVEIQH